MAANKRLPQYVSARRTKRGILYYYQRDGKKVPLGRSYHNAEERAMAILANPLETAHIRALNVENIIASAIPAKRQSGIYFLILNGAIAYIGQAADVWLRITQHMASRRFDAFSWAPCPVSELDRMEAYCIEKFKPLHNAGIRPNFRTRSINQRVSH